MKTYLRFLWSIIRHKWYVLVAGRRLQVSLWRLLIHDLSKLTPAEFGSYARHFYGKEIDPRDFTAAWHFHKLRNDHHWENWVSVEGNKRYRVVHHNGNSVLFTDPRDLRTDEADCIPDNIETYPLTAPEVTVLPMPMVCVREMVADWFAAGKAYNGAWPVPTDYAWYKANRPKMHLHPITRMRIVMVLAEAAQWEWK